MPVESDYVVFIANSYFLFITIDQQVFVNFVSFYNHPEAFILETLYNFSITHGYCSPHIDFCLSCLIFGSPNANRTTMYFTTEGYRVSETHNLSRNIESHEKSEYHRNFEISLIRWKSGKMRLDKKMLEEHNYRVIHLRAVVSVAIDVIRYLSQEMMGFRKNKTTEGKFFKLFFLLAKYNADAQIYLEKVKEHYARKKRMRVNFLAYDSVFTLICIMKKMVVAEISERILKAKYYSIIVDSTQDTSKLESTVVLIRYTEGFGDSLSKSPQPAPVERLIEVFTSKETSGKILYDKTKALLIGGK